MHHKTVLTRPFAPTRRAQSGFSAWRLKTIAIIGGLLAIFDASTQALAQSPDCVRLLQQIAAAGRGGGGSRLGGAARRQQGELSKTISYAHAIGCDRTQFLFFGGNRPPQCDALNAQIARMQANLAALQNGASGDYGLKRQLQNQYDSMCRPRQNRGLLETIFGGDEMPPDRRYDVPPDRQDPREQRGLEDGGDDDEGSVNANGARTYGGRYAVCVRSCDGGFFPVSYAARPSSLDDLQQLCTALCPNTEAKLYTRKFGGDMKAAIAAAGGIYTDHPNAFKFEKSFDSSCVCRPPDKSWSEALSDAEKLLGQAHKGDILVTPEKADELSRPAQPGEKPENRKKRRDTAHFDPIATAKILHNKQEDATPSDKNEGLLGTE